MAVNPLLTPDLPPVTVVLPGGKKLVVSNEGVPLTTALDIPVPQGRAGLFEPGIPFHTKTGSVGIPSGHIVTAIKKGESVTVPFNSQKIEGLFSDKKEPVTLVISKHIVVDPPKPNFVPPPPPPEQPTKVSKNRLFTRSRILKSTPLAFRSQPIHEIGGITLPWVERVKGGWTGDMQWSVDGSILSSTFILPRSSVWTHEAATKILGYAKRGPAITGGYAIDRKMPMRHPAFPWMRAVRISKAEGIGVDPGGKIFSQDNAGVNKDPETTLRAEPINYEDGPFFSPAYFAITIAFETPPYRVAVNGGRNPATAAAAWYTPGVTTDKLNAEWNRFVIQNIEPSCEFLSHERQSISWAAGSTDHTAPFVGGVGWRLEKTRFRWTWVQVPEQGLFDSTLGSNVLDAVGKVNAYDFLASGDAGTLLMEAPRFVPKIMPINPRDLYTGSDLDLDAAPRSFDVEINMVKFDPRPGDTTVRGHNLMPSPRSRMWWLVHASLAYLSVTVTAVSGNLVTVASTSGITLGSVLVTDGATVPNFTQVRAITSSTQFEVTKTGVGTGGIKLHLAPYESYDFTKVFKLR